MGAQWETEVEVESLAADDSFGRLGAIKIKKDLLSDCLRVLVCLLPYVWVLSACKSIGSHIIISSLTTKRVNS